jgi:hypothetical protein
VAKQKDTKRVQPKRKSKFNIFLEKVSYKGLVENLPFFAFIVLLCIVYITSNYRAVETQRALEKEQNYLKELRWKHMDIKTQLMKTGVEANIIKKGAEIGLAPMTLPAYEVRAQQTNKNLDSSQQ